MSAFTDYIEAHFDTERVSGNSQLKLSGTCPFCGATSSDLRLYVSIAKDSGICFHCETGFGAVKFVAANEGCTWSQAKKLLGGDEDPWVKTPSGSHTSSGMVFPPTVPVEDSVQASVYLSGRGMGADIIDHFQLAFCPRNVEIPLDDGSTQTMYTKGRIYIPVLDLAGNVCAWQARDTSGRAKNKYLFPRGFEGAKYVYNAHAIPAGLDFLIVCEGVMDVFGWWRAGFKNVVATFGKKLSKPQFDILLELSPKRLVLAWDSDAEWQRQEFAEQFGHGFKEVRICDLGGKDADELGRAALIAALKASRTPNWYDKILFALGK